MFFIYEVLCNLNITFCLLLTAGAENITIYKYHQAFLTVLRVCQSIVRDVFCANLQKFTYIQKSYEKAVSSAISIISQKLVSLSSAVHSSPVNGQSDIVHMLRAFLLSLDAVR